jgi:hypothetical protein
MKTPIMSRWYVKLTIGILIVAVIYLTYKSFMSGFEGGRRIKMQREQAK